MTPCLTVNDSQKTLTPTLILNDPQCRAYRTVAFSTVIEFGTAVYSNAIILSFGVNNNRLCCRLYSVDIWSVLCRSDMWIVAQYGDGFIASAPGSGSSKVRPQYMFFALELSASDIL